MPNPKLESKRIYVKNASVENPSSPRIFSIQGNPADEYRIGNSHTVLDEPNHYEVVLEVIVITKVSGMVLTVVKVQQAGIFKIEDATPDQIKQILATECLMCYIHMRCRKHRIYRYGARTDQYQFAL